MSFGDWWWAFTNMHAQIVLREAVNNTKRKTWLLARPGETYQNRETLFCTGRVDWSGEILYLSDHEKVLQKACLATWIWRWEKNFQAASCI